MWGTEKSPVNPLNARHEIEMAVATQNRKGVLTAKRRNPNVVGRDGFSETPKSNVDGCIVVCGGLSYVEHSRIGDKIIQPARIANSVARLGDPVTILSQHDHGQDQLIRLGQGPNQCGVFIGGRRKCVGIENHSQFSGSTCSKVPSMIRLIRSVSLCKCFSLPICFSHGFVPGVLSTLSLSSTASVT